MITVSFEGVLDVVLEFADALQDVVQCAVRVLLLVEQLRPDGVDHALHRTHVEDAVVEELVQLAHVVEQEQLVHVHRVARNAQLARTNPQAQQKGDDLLLCLRDGQLTG